MLLKLKTQTYWIGKSLIEKLPVVMPDVWFDEILSAAELWDGSGSEHREED